MSNYQVIPNGLWPKPLTIDLAGIPKGFTIENWLEANSRLGVSLIDTMRPITESYRMEILHFDTTLEEITNPNIQHIN